jgi:hypothetical protein
MLRDDVGCHKFSSIDTHIYSAMLCYCICTRVERLGRRLKTMGIIMAEESLHEAEVDLRMSFQRNGVEEDLEDCILYLSA